MLSFEYCKPNALLVLMVQDWRSGGTRFKSHPSLTFQSWSSYQLNQLGSKATSDPTFKQSTILQGIKYCVLYFLIKLNYEAVLNLRYGQTFFVALIVAGLPEPEAELENGIGCDVDCIGVQYRLLPSLLAHFCKSIQQQTSFHQSRPTGWSIAR